MESKLIKIEDNYHLENDGNIIAGSHVADNYKYKLSLKNCEAITIGYDLDELAEEYATGKSSSDVFKEAHKKDFIAGANAILELLGDKKFSLKELKDSLLHFISEVSSEDGELIGKTPVEAYNWIENHVQSLQQNEWDVEIEMEYQGFEEDGKLREAYLPKLDADGCLILKRKV